MLSEKDVVRRSLLGSPIHPLRSDPPHFEDSSGEVYFLLGDRRRNLVLSSRRIFNVNGPRPRSVIYVSRWRLIDSVIHAQIQTSALARSHSTRALLITVIRRAGTNLGCSACCTLLTRPVSLHRLDDTAR